MHFLVEASLLFVLLRLLRLLALLLTFHLHFFHKQKAKRCLCRSPLSLEV